MDQVKLIEVMSEIGAGTRGASLSMDALRIAALDFRSNYFRTHETIRVDHENELLYDKPGNFNARRIQGVIRMYERISATVKDVLLAGDFPIIISADHSNAGGTIAGIKSAYPEQRLGVIWIDAHADLHSPFTTPSGNLHGMPLCASLNEDNLKHRKNNVDEPTTAQWQQLKNIAGIAPKFNYSDLVYVTLRDMEEEERYLIDTNRVMVQGTDDLRKKGINKVVREITSHLYGCEKIYISFDVDSMDQQVSKGTGTPVIGGITDKEATNLILELLQNEEVCCFEMSEINPTLDNENTMSEIAFEILQKVTSQLEF
jgi:arginase